MDMKKILLSMILLALCLIQASADDYYYKIKLYNDNHQLDEWSGYIKVSYDAQQDDWVHGLRDLIAGKTVTDGHRDFTLLNKDNKVDLDKIYGIVFANGKGKDKNEQEKIMEGGEYKAWEKIREHIKYLELREYKLNTYTGDYYFANMHKVEQLELPEGGMTVGDGVNNMYFANADNLKEITIWSAEKNAAVDITDYAGKVLQNSVGQYMFSNCYSLSTKYINRLIEDVTEIKNNAFSVDKDNRGKFSDEADNKMAIEIPSSVKKIGDQAFWNRVKVTGLNIQGDGGSLEIGSEAFRGCEQLNALNINKAKINHLGTGVFGDCRSMTNEFVKDVLENYEGTKIPAYLFYGCNGQDGHDGSDANKNKCSFTDLNIPAKFSEIGDGAFASSGDAKIKLKTITVNRDKAPLCLCGETDKYANITKKSVFDGLEPNMTTVIFANDAESWKVDETTGKETTGFLTYMNDGSEFQRLLTKDLFSDSKVLKFRI